MPNCGTCGLYIHLQYHLDPQGDHNSHLNYLIDKAVLGIERGMTPKAASKDIFLYWRSMEHSHAP